MGGLMAGKPQPIKHGTIGGYMAHRRREEAPCGSCTTAWRIYYQDRNGDKPRRVYLRDKMEAKYQANLRKEQRKREHAVRRAKRAEQRRLDQRGSNEEAT